MYLSYFLYFCTGNSIFELIFAYLMTNLRELINTKIARIMADILGHFNNFITLSLSLSLRYLTASPPHLITYAPVRVNIRLSMLSAMGSLIVFCIYLIQFLLL